MTQIHTPGPWSAKRDPGEPNRSVIFDSSGDWLMAIQHNGHALDARQQADLNLAAAGPVLLEALSAALRAAKNALFVINKQGVMPNSSWDGGLKADIAVAEATLAKFREDNTVEPYTPRERPDTTVPNGADPSDGQSMGSGDEPEVPADAAGGSSPERHPGRS